MPPKVARVYLNREVLGGFAARRPSLTMALPGRGR